MNILKTKIANGIFVFTMASMAGMSANADDTEIFFGGATSAVVPPNVLFVLDTSGSMNYTDDDDDGNEQPPRIDRMKTAFKQILGEINNVNVGLMRFHRNGGSVIYPVTHIDKPDPTANTYLGNTSSRISSNDSDAEEANGIVTLGNEVLEISHRAAFGPSQTSSVSISNGNDDVVEWNNTIYTDHDELGVPLYYNNTYYVLRTGLIFRDLGIPQGAIVEDAQVEFTIGNKTNNNRYRNFVEMNISGQTGPSANIANFSNSNRITTRNKTSNTSGWEITQSPDVGSKLTTTSFVPVMQELVNQSDWTTNSDAALFLEYPYGNTPQGTRDLRSRNNSSSGAPKLNVTYKQATGSSTAQTVGLRFSELDIPQGVTITSARVEFKAARSTSDTASFTVYGEAADNSAPFQATSNNLSSRALTSAVLNWAPGAWTQGQDYSTDDIKDVIQEIVNRPDWCGGNALSLLITGSGTRAAVSNDQSGSLAPQLVVDYDPDSVPADGGCVSGALSYRVNNSSDDAEHNLSNGDVTMSGSTLSLGYDGSTKQAVGIRFTNIDLPKNAEIASAYLEFTAKGSTNSTSSFVIHAESSDNPGTYSSSRKPNGLSALGTTVNWTSVPNWTGGQQYRSPDISSLVQDLVDRAGWNRGNAMSFIIKTSVNGSRRDAASFDENGLNAPRLVINAKGSPTDFLPTARTTLINMIDDLTAAGGTPIVDVMYEAARYYKGMSVMYGKSRYGYGNSSSDYSQYYRVSHPDSYTGGNVVRDSRCTDANLNSSYCKSERIDGSPVYKSPIVDQCQTNHIVLLTDGEATENRSDDDIRNMTGDSSCAGNDNAEECGVELTDYLYSEDQASGLPEKQTIVTHTIGFNFSGQFLEDLANVEVNADGEAIEGSGKYVEAESADELVEELKAILISPLTPDTTFVSPGVTVNSFNRLSHRNEVYFSLFQPKETEYWPGNLKRYKLRSDGTILDSKDANAVDTDTGMFKETAQSFWSDVVDGNKTAVGGAAYKLPPHANRKLYTYYDGANKNLTQNPISVANKANITKDRLGIASESDAYHENLINWIRGQDIKDINKDSSTTDDRNQIADPLHSSPYLVTYGGTEEDPDITVYFGDNEGLLHAIDAKTGVEQFAFAPGELLTNFDALYQNKGLTRHIYGMDGFIAAWVQDNNANSIIEKANDDHVYIYAGMRRGGRNYYALDVTDRSTPKVLWTITGGSGEFASLGQTWARPIKTKINVNGTVTDVLIISGGYDDDQDNYNIRTEDNMGNAIFIVNAETGDLIWSVGNSGAHDLNLSDMKYSIPATTRAIDVNADGVTDQFYVGDTGGQIWRFDVNNGQQVSNLVSGAVIAELADDTASGNRRFYHEPSVSIVVENNIRKLVVAIGTGFHAHPLGTAIQDRYYMIRQNAISTAPADEDEDGVPDYEKLTHDDLYDTTSNIIENGSDEEVATATTALGDAQGWYIDLIGEYQKGVTAPGEKTMAAPLILNGVLYFTTYQPDVSTSAVAQNCKVSDTAPRKLYSIHLADGTPITEGTDTWDRYNFLKGNGLPSSPIHVRIADDEGTSDLIGVGTEFVDASSGNIVTKTFWYSH